MKNTYCLYYKIFKKLNLPNSLYSRRAVWARLKSSILIYKMSFNFLAIRTYILKETSLVEFKMFISILPLKRSRIYLNIFKERFSFILVAQIFQYCILVPQIFQYSSWKYLLLCILVLRILRTVFSETSLFELWKVIFASEFLHLPDAYTFSSKSPPPNLFTLKLFIYNNNI